MARVFMDNLRPRRGPGRLPWLVWAAVFASSAGVVVPSAQIPQQAGDADLEQTLLRVGRRLEQWYSRAQTVVSEETVWIQPLGADMSPSDVPRRLAFELRVDWDPSRTSAAGEPEATVLRQALGLERGAARSDHGCVDPKPVSPEPLGILLPARRGESSFTPGGTAQVNDRRALVIDYRGLGTLPPVIHWSGECVSVALHGRSRGRIWVDAETYDVLRLSDRLVGTFELPVPQELVRRGAAPTMIIERAETTIRYRHVQFEDPREVLTLPDAVDTVAIWRGTAVRRYRISQRLSRHRRYLTDARLLY
ncbi:MAG: hypothetical protein ACREKH_02815 [Candidatus Rokuibacteriota bacterium]